MKQDLFLNVLEFVFIFSLQLAGISLHCMQKIKDLDNKFPDMSTNEIVSTFWENDKFTLWISGIVLWINILAHLIIHLYTPDVILMIPHFILWAFLVAFVLGYAGQRLVYKFLGTAESVINKQIEVKSNGSKD